MIQQQVKKAQIEFVKLMLLFEEYYSEAAWKWVTEVESEYNALSTESARPNAVKQQIMIKVKRFGWKNAIIHGLEMDIAILH